MFKMVKHTYMCVTGVVKLSNLSRVVVITKLHVVIYIDSKKYSY